VVTGHECSDKEKSTTDWSALARIPTLIVLMGLTNAACIAQNLMDAGLAPTTPAAAISQGTTDDQRIVISTVAELAQAIADAELASPAILVIGEVAALAHELAWFTPAGQTAGFLSLAATPGLRLAQA
jgi:uroporphyrin-III C-methyltransferase